MSYIFFTFGSGVIDSPVVFSSAAPVPSCCSAPSPSPCGCLRFLLGVGVSGSSSEPPSPWPAALLSLPPLPLPPWRLRLFPVLRLLPLPVPQHEASADKFRAQLRWQIPAEVVLLAQLLPELDTIIATGTFHQRVRVVFLASFALAARATVAFHVQVRGRRACC